MKICFFARVENLEVLERVQFYAQDIRILQELGHKVIIATRFREIPIGCDLYYIWWWSWALLPLFKAFLSGSKPTLITGVLDYSLPDKSTGQSFVDRPWWQRWAILCAFRFGKRNVFVSKYEFNDIPKKIFVRNPLFVPLVVDTSLYKPIQGLKEPIIFNVAWSGELNAKRKCLFQIVEAFSIIKNKHPHFRLVMAGKQGEYHSKLVERAVKLGLIDSIDFLGVVSEEKKIKLMQRCSIYLQPTLFEGFGLAIAEAMSCGAVVVSSAVGAIREVVSDAGAMVNGEDPKEIADKVNSILDNPYLIEDLSSRARLHIVNNFSFENRKNGIERIIAELSVNCTVS